MISFSKKHSKKFGKYAENILSEEIDPKTKSYLGNHSQAFSHIGYIMSAYYIDRYEKKLGKKQIFVLSAFVMSKERFK